jgi:hypothetical protein
VSEVASEVAWAEESVAGSEEELEEVWVAASVAAWGRAQAAGSEEASEEELEEAWGRAQAAASEEGKWVADPSGVRQWEVVLSEGRWVADS